ncbi:MAG: NYN domain-containing protein, partial [Fimbriimonadales bacterium]
LYGNDGKLDMQTIKTKINADKVFFYDALGDEPVKHPAKTVTAEQQADFNRKVERYHFRKELHEVLRHMDGFHVRLGQVRERDRNRRGVEQKEVDILLAVEALTHASRRNMDYAVLIAGDVDFRPLVDALVQLGIFVTIYSHGKGRDLALSGDSHRWIDYFTLMEWSDATWQRKNPADSISRHLPVTRMPIEFARTAKGELICIFKGDDLKFFAQYEHDPNRYFCRDYDILKRFLEMHAAEDEVPIEWGLPLSTVAADANRWW